MSNDGETEKHSATPILIGLIIGLVVGLIANFVGVAGRETPAAWVTTAVAIAQPVERSPAHPALCTTVKRRFDPSPPLGSPEQSVTATAARSVNESDKHARKDGVVMALFRAKG